MYQTYSNISLSYDFQFGYASNIVRVWECFSKRKLNAPTSPNGSAFMHLATLSVPPASLLLHQLLQPSSPFPSSSPFFPLHCLKALTLLSPLPSRFPHRAQESARRTQQATKRGARVELQATRSKRARRLLPGFMRWVQPSRRERG